MEDPTRRRDTVKVEILHAAFSCIATGCWNARCEVEVSPGVEERGGEAKDEDVEEPAQLPMLPPLLDLPPQLTPVNVFTFVPLLLNISIHSKTLVNLFTNLKYLPTIFGSLTINCHIWRLSTRLRTLHLLLSQLPLLLSVANAALVQERWRALTGGHLVGPLRNLALGSHQYFAGAPRPSPALLLGNRGHITACRAPKRPPTGKRKVSRVTSGYVDVMISLSRVRLYPARARAG